MEEKMTLFDNLCMHREVHINISVFQVLYAQAYVRNTTLRVCFCNIHVFQHFLFSFCSSPQQAFHLPNLKTFFQLYFSQCYKDSFKTTKLINYRLIQNRAQKFLFRFFYFRIWGNCLDIQCLSYTKIRWGGGGGIVQLVCGCVSVSLLFVCL